MVPLSKFILVQDNDFIKAGMALTDGATTPNDILSIKGPTAVQEYLVNEIQEVYRLQGVKINDKHIEVIVRQMMQKVEIIEPGDTNFMTGQVVDKFAFREENDHILDKKVVMDAGDSSILKPGQIISSRRLRDENSNLKRKDLKIAQVRDAEAAVSRPTLQGITQASLGTESFISAASFQETTKVLSEAAVRGKADYLLGLKENVIVGHLIPAGTGLRQYGEIIVGSQDEYNAAVASKEAFKESSRKKEFQN
jgi:DNA-directed RNA polymerase subunit beta'